MRSRSRIQAAVALLCAATVTACGNVTAGGVGEAKGYMSANASDGSPSPVGYVPEGTAPMRAVVGAGLQGDLTVTASIEIRHASGPLIELTPLGEITTTLDLQGALQPVFSEPVPQGDYDAMRIVFTEVSADVTGGLEIGGAPFAGTVTVDLGAGGREVVRSVDFNVPVQGSVDLLIDLNADAWLPLLNIVTQTVTADDFAGAVLVSAP